MKRVTSFKAQYKAPPRSATPPRPVWEPLSPTLRPTQQPYTTGPAGGSHSQATSSRGYANGGAIGAPVSGDARGASLQLDSSTVTYDAPLRSAPLPQPPLAYTLPRGSPIEALADAAVSSQRPPSAYADPSRRASYAAASPMARLHPTSERAQTHAYAYDAAHSYSDRPAKRARSEHHASPTYGVHHSRPATSHIPGYNVEQMMESGRRMYQDTRPAPPQHTNGGDKMLSDAELLLFFSNVSAHTAHTPPSTAKRWSVSQASPPAPALFPQQTPQTVEPSSPRPAPPQASSNTHFQSYNELPDAKPRPEPPSVPTEMSDAVPAPQTQTPPEETVKASPKTLAQEHGPAEDPKLKKQQSGSKGKPRGARSTPSTGKRKRSTPKPKNAISTSTSGAPDQLQSPQSLPAEQPAPIVNAQPTAPAHRTFPPTSPSNRRHSFSNTTSENPGGLTPPPGFLRAQSVPLGGSGGEQPNFIPSSTVNLPRSSKKTVVEQPDLICAACKSSDSEVKVGDGEQWVGCDGCKEWYHYACAGFNSEREVRDVNKFYCGPCRPKFGETTKVRKSIRAHTTVDYAGLNEGVLKTSDDNPEHHYIAAFKNGDIDFTPETFARMPAELITADFLQKTNGFKEPILVPTALNGQIAATSEEPRGTPAVTEPVDEENPDPPLQFEYETTTDLGQDKLDMVIPKGLTVRRVAELYGPNETVPVIDVKAQEGEGKKWTMSKWADYYEQQGEKPVRNVISLEVSRSRLGRLIRRPKAVREMDLQGSVWRSDDKNPPPSVQFYCLMSVADCFTDFHIDFGGSSVYYHIVKGRKVFFFIPPTKQNLKKYEDWCLSPNQGHDWLGKQVKECYRVDLYPGDTMLIPSGWIHAVWTPENSLVIGGNFLTRIHYGMQIKILEIEKNTKVGLQFRYPFFQKIMWLTAIKYLDDDRLPIPVQRLLESGEQFKRSIPIYCEPDRWGNNSHLGETAYNRRYYSKHELEGLTDLLNYIWRTVLISLDKIDVPQKVRGSVIRSIPKGHGHGEPLAVVKKFAMWIAWKRGNETVQSWALPDANLPEVAESSEKKLSAAQVKKMERDSHNEALRATAERSSARIRASDVPTPMRDASPALALPMNGMDDVFQMDAHSASTGSLTGFLRPSANNPHITTPKTSQLGPKRVACDACRKRRIRCKHKDELIDTSKPGMHTIDLSGSYGISVKRRLSDHSIVEGQTNVSSGPVNGGPIMADVNGDPYALKSGRVKACADCRKSKRRCIHDEHGKVDPIKANEVPIPRGSASKRRRVSDEDSNSAVKRMRHEASFESDYMNGDFQTRHSLPTQFSSGSSLLQDIAFSAQQALARDEDDLVPVDPALQAFVNGGYSAMDTNGSYASNGDGIVSSIEDRLEGDIPMEGIEFALHNGGGHGPSVEPLTPGPPPHNDSAHVQTNGHSMPATTHGKLNGYNLHSQDHAVRPPLSPVSPRHTSAISPGTDPYSYMTSSAHDAYNFTADTDFPPPPVTPSVNAPRTSRPPNSSGQKAAHTPSRPRASKTPKSTPGARRHDSRDAIKLEAGLGMGMNGMGVNGLSMNAALLSMDVIDPSLDQASIDLIKQLQQEELGLRRRSR